MYQTKFLTKFQEMYLMMICRKYIFLFKFQEIKLISTM